MDPPKVKTEKLNVMVTVPIPVERWERLDKRAAKLGITTRRLIQRIVKEAVRG